jgi:hypothetical protein
MRRRDFISLLGGAASWPIAARAQSSGMPVIGYVGTGSANGARELVAAFHSGLKEMGYTEGQDFRIDYRWFCD